MLANSPLTCTTPVLHVAFHHVSVCCLQVGMQSSALAAVLAKIHFPYDPMIVAPCVLSACTHATIGSLLAGYWNATSKDDE